MLIADDVKKRTPDDYQNVTQAEVDRLQEFPEVLSVYSTGMVKAPGISDLDLIAVVDLEKSANRVQRSLKRALRFPTENYIRTHPIFVISPQVFSQLRWLADLSTLTNLAGQNLEALPLPEIQQDLLRAVAILEIGVHKFFSLRNIARSKSMGARDLLLTLNSIGYSLSLAVQLAECSESLQLAISQFRADLLELRSNWFETQPTQQHEQLATLIEQAPHLLLQSLEVASKHLVQKYPQENLRDAGKGLLNVNPYGLIELDRQRPQAIIPFEKNSFRSWCQQPADQPHATLQGPVGMAISFAFYHDYLQTQPKSQRYLHSLTHFDQGLRDWCLSATGQTRNGLEQRAEVMCEYAKWYRQFWSCAVPFSAHTPMLMGQRSKLEKLWARIENRSLR